MRFFESVLLALLASFAGLNVWQLAHDTNWDFHELRWFRAGVAVALFVLSGLVHQAIRRVRFNLSESASVWGVPGLLFSAGLLAGHDHRANLLFGVFLGVSILYAFSIRCLCLFIERKLKVRFTLSWLHFVVIAFIVLHSELFILMMTKRLDATALFALFFMHSGLGLFQLVADRSAHRKPFLSDQSTSHQLILSSLVGLLFLSYVTGQLPQTMADGVVYRLPTLAQMASEHVWPFHDYLWIRLIPQPFILLLFPAYIAFGEMGASWTVWLFAALCAGAIYDLTRLYTKDRFASLLAAVLFLATPPYWILTTALFNDISLVFFSVAGLALVKRGVASSSQFDWQVGLASLGFATAIKLNAPVVFLPSLIAILFAHRSELRRLITLRSTFISLVAGLIVAGPSFTFIQKLTGNPVFPFLERVFPNKMGPVEVLNAQSLIQFHFDFNLRSIIMLPYDISFSTSKFGEYLNGTFGITLIFLTVSLLILVVFGVYRNQRARVSPALFQLIVPSLLAFFLIVLAIQMANLRYWITGYALCEIGLVSVFAAVVSKAALRLVGLSLALVSICFLVVFGARLNFEVPDGLGTRVFFGQQTRADWLWSIDYGIPEFLNSHTPAGESIFSTGFLFVHRIKPKSFYVSNLQALLGRLETPELLNRFVEDHQVRYWILDSTTSDAFLVKMGAVPLYLKPSRIVFGGGRFVVYDLKPRLPGSVDTETSKLTHANSSVASLAQPWRYEISRHANTEVLSITATVEPRGPTSHGILQLVFRGETQNEIARSVVSSERKNSDPFELRLVTGFPPGTKSAELTIRTLLDSDSPLEVQDVALEETKRN